MKYLEENIKKLTLICILGFSILALSGCFSLKNADSTSPETKVSLDPTESNLSNPPQLKLEDQIVGVWLTDDDMPWGIVDFTQYGKVIHSPIGNIYTYEVKSETTIISENVIYDILSIDSKNLDLIVNSAAMDIHQDRRFKKAADPIIDFSSKIIGHWEVEFNDCIRIEEEYLQTGLSIFQMHNNCNEEEELLYYESIYSVESDNTICITPNQRFFEVEFTPFCSTYLNIDGNRAVIAIRNNDVWEFPEWSKVGGFPNLSEKIIGKWLVSSGEVTGILEFAVDGTVIDHDKGSINTYEILSPDIIRISNFPSVFWVEDLNESFLKMSYEGFLLEYVKK